MDFVYTSTSNPNFSNALSLESTTSLADALRISFETTNGRVRTRLFKSNNIPQDCPKSFTVIRYGITWSIRIGYRAFAVTEHC